MESALKNKKRPSCLWGLSCPSQEVFRCCGPGRHPVSRTEMSSFHPSGC